MGGQVQVDVTAQLAERPGLGQVRAQPLPEPVELGVLQFAQRRVAERPAPEADLDLGLEVPPLVPREQSASRAMAPMVAFAMPSRAITRQVADKISSRLASQSTIFGMSAGI